MIRNRTLALFFSFFAFNCSFCKEGPNPLNKEHEDSYNLQSHNKDISIQKIWDNGVHNAFTDMILFDGRFYCSFREGENHNPTASNGANGTVRILSSSNGIKWESVAILKKEGIDLRDPKLSVTPNGKIMVIIGGSRYENGKLTAQIPHVSFSDSNGQNFIAPEVISFDPSTRFSNSNWIWRVTWHGGTGYAVNYQGPSIGALLLKTTDGRHFTQVHQFDNIDGFPNEATVRFDSKNQMHIVIRRDYEDKMALIMTASAPFSNWSVEKINHRLGGPNLLLIGEDERKYIGARIYTIADHVGILREETNGQFVEAISLPSSGDCGYPGMLVKDNHLYMSYYSSHEGKSSIYFCSIPLSMLATSRTFSEDATSNKLNANNTIRSVVADKQGNIYAAGNFRNADDRYYVAQWNRESATWRELGGVGILYATSIIQCISLDKDDNMLTSGDFNNGRSKKYIAKWNKETNLWGELGGFNSLEGSSTVFAVSTDRTGNVYAGGHFVNSNGNRYVAVYDGLSWKELGGADQFNKTVGTQGAIFSITSDGEGNVYACGEFKNKNGQTYIAKWDKRTNSWGELGGENSFLGNGSINCAITDEDGNIYVAGAFKNNSGHFYVAKYDKTTGSWSEVGNLNGLSANGFIRALTSDAQGNVYVAGAFKNQSGRYYVAKWSKTTNSWSEISNGGNALQVNDVILSIAVDEKENIYVGGNFKNANGFHYVAVWNGTTWGELDNTSDIQN